MPVIVVRADKAYLTDAERARLAARITGALSALVPPEKVQIFFEARPSHPTMTARVVGDIERGNAVYDLLAGLGGGWVIDVRHHAPEWTARGGVLRRSATGGAVQ